MAINSKDKSGRGEREVYQRLEKRFNLPFSRSAGSGNRWSQVKSLPKHATETYSGDLCCPEGFAWVVEVKFGYDDVKLDAGICKKIAQLDEFIDQVAADSLRCGRKPLLVWRQSRRPWFAFVLAEENAAMLANIPYGLVYRDWRGVWLESLLSLDDRYFFLRAEDGAAGNSATKPSFKCDLERSESGSTQSVGIAGSTQ